MIRRQRCNDHISCPICGSALICSGGTEKCTSCEYELTISEFYYTNNRSHRCMICGGVLNQNELQICAQCKDKIADNFIKWTLEEESK